MQNQLSYLVRESSPYFPSCITNNHIDILNALKERHLTLSRFPLRFLQKRTLYNGMFVTRCIQWLVNEQFMTIVFIFLNHDNSLYTQNTSCTVLPLLPGKEAGYSWIIIILNNIIIMFSESKYLLLLHTLGTPILRVKFKICFILHVLDRQLK